MSELARNISRFFILILIQVFLLGKMNLFGYAFPFIFIFFILFLPIRLPNWAVLLIGFGTGLLLDVFSNTLGLYAAATTLIAFLRPFILRRLTPQYDVEDENYLDIYNRTIPQYSIYAFIMSFAFCLLFFFLERFSTKGLFTTIGQIIASTFLTFVLLLIYRYLFVPASLKRRS